MSHHQQGPPGPVPFGWRQPAPVRKTSKKTIALSCAGAALFWVVVGSVAGVGTGTDDRADAPVSASPQSDLPGAGLSVSASPPGFTRRDLTELSIDVAWSGTGQSDRDIMCSGVLLFGTAWAADQMRDAMGSGDPGLDWDYAAVLIADKCVSDLEVS